jgi:alkylhydroperoxidase family enzyme
MSAHSALARQKGASEEQVRAVGDFESGPFTEAEKLGFRYADRLHRSPLEIDDAFYASARNVFDDRQIIELTAVAAAYEYFTRFVDALRIPTTPLTPPKADPSPHSG